MDSRSEPALMTSNPAGISDDWTSLILAIDYLLVMDSEEWSKKLAVLTREALYLLEPETGEPDPLMPFGRTWWRIAVKDFADVQYVSSERSLRICTTARWEKIAWLATAHAAAPLQKPRPRAPGLLSRPTRSALCRVDSDKEATLARWRRPMVANSDAGSAPAADSGCAGTSNLFERDAQLAEAPNCSDIRRWHGVIGAVWHELTEPSALKTAFESCLPGDMPSLGRRPSSPGFGSSWLTQQSRPWRADALPPILALGTLLKERDGLLWGGWTERTFVLMQNGQLLYYLRTPDSNDEATRTHTPTPQP